jgi:hypothetical protein
MHGFITPWYMKSDCLNSIYIHILSIKLNNIVFETLHPMVSGVTNLLKKNVFETKVDRLIIFKLDYNITDVVIFWLLFLKVL